MYFFSFLPVVSRYSLSIQPFLNLSAYSQWRGRTLFYNFVLGRLCATMVLGMSSWCQDLPCKLPGILAAALEPYSSSSPVDTSLGWTGAWPEWGSTDLERGYGDVRPWRPPFHASPAARKGPISSKRVSSQDPILRKFGNFGPCSLNFHPNFSSQAPKFGNFQLTSPQIWKFSAHKPPFSEANVSSQAPHFGNQGRTPLPEKSWVPPPPVHGGSVLWFRERCLLRSAPIPPILSHTPPIHPTPNNPTHHHTHKPSYSFILTRKEIYFAYELQITSVPKS